MAYEQLTRLTGEQFVKNNEVGATIETPTGPRKFSGIAKTWHKKILQVDFANGVTLKCGFGHVFVCEEGFTRADQLVVGSMVSTKNWDLLAVTKITELPGEFMYDFLDVDGGSLYIAKGIIQHNCEFLSSDALLINSMVLHKLRSTPPVYTDMGFRFWAPPKDLGGHEKTYLVGIDPATGTGSDFSVIEIFEFPSLRQVAEWRSNEINVPLLYAKIKWVLEFLTRNVTGKGRAEVLWSFERNGIGEALSSLYTNDENQPEFAELFSDASNRSGVFTSGQTKINTCIQLKTLVERAATTLNSDILIEELKNYIAKGNTYDHKIGATGDCVSALLVVMRLLKRLSEYDETAFKRVNEYVAPDSPDALFTPDDNEPGWEDTSSSDSEPFPMMVM